MGVVQAVLDGFSVVAEPQNLLYVLIGVVVGMVIGVLPGLGPSATIALLLPLTYVMPPESAIIMLAGIYYGAYYGGTITSVILRVPGEAASVVTTFDGYQMAQQGRAGPALGISAIGSFVGGVIAVVGMMALAPYLADFALEFGPPEYAALALFALLIVAYLGNTSFTKNIIAACFGLLVATVGIDTVSGASRFTFGTPELLQGIGFIPAVMGLFGLGDILYNIEVQGKLSQTTGRITQVWPARADFRRSRGPIARGSVIGFVLGMIPGGGGVVSSLASYATEKRISKTPQRFGRGAIEGVAGPETANNAGSTSAFIPLLTLGIPSNIVLALIFGALLIQGITPGPQLIVEHPEIFWGVICSMIIGNLVLLLLSLPLVKVFVQLARVRLGILATVIVVVTMAAVYSVSNSAFDMWIMVAFGVLGYAMRKTGFDPGPLVLAIVLGPLLETSFRQTMIISDGSLGIFVARPIPAILLAITALTVAAAAWRAARRPRRRPARYEGPDGHDEEPQPQTGSRGGG